MRLSVKFLAVLAFVCSVQTWGAPMITGGPVNAASYVLAGLPNANIAQGSMFILFGQNMGPAVQANAFSFPLPKMLGGTSIAANVGGTNVDAIMLYSNSTQVAAILPSSAPIGAGTVTLTFNGQPSNTVTINVMASTLGIFTRNQGGSGPGVLFNFNSQSDQPVNSLVTAAHPGQVLTLWGTGLGKVSGDEAGGPLPGNLSVPVDVFVGTKQVSPTYKGRSGCCAGIDQVVFTVPDGVEGCYVSVNVRVGGVISNSATIAVTSSGTVCSDPTGFSTADLRKVQGGQGLTVGDITTFRLHAKLSAGPLATESNVDFGEGFFRHYVSSADVLASTRGSLGAFNGLPSAGSCTMSPFAFQDLFSSLFGGGGDPVNQVGWDAGPMLNITGPDGMKQLPRQDIGTPGQPFYRYHVHGNEIGGGIPGILTVTPAYLDPGNYTVDNGAGGSQVGGFHAGLTIPRSTIAWTNEDALGNIPLSRDLTLTWSNATAGGFVAVIGTSADPKTGAGAAFQCLTPADAGNFTVPAWVLSALPASGPDPATGVPVGFLSVGTALLAPARFQASGLYVGFFNWAHLETRNVVFQASLTGVGQANSVPYVNQPLVPSAAAAAGPGFTLTVNGTGFVSGSAVNWNGTALTTTFVSRKQLTATVPVAEVASAGTASITVFNPAPGGGTSNLAYFEITSPTTSGSFATNNYAAGAGPRWVTVGDFNDDGKLDLAVANYGGGNTVSVLVGNGDGTFHGPVNYSAGPSPYEVRVGDFNGDGKLDLAVADAGGGVGVLLGNGDGTFQPAMSYPAGSLSTSVAVGDFNGDGKLDLAVVNLNSSNVSVLLGNGDGTFQPALNYAAGALPFKVTMGDFNDDGKLDLAVANQGGTSVSVLLGNGDGTFQAPVNYTAGANPQAITAADFNGDGKLDLAVGNWGGDSLSVLLGNGDGTFQAPVNYATDASPYAIAVGDFNGDGKPDLAVANFFGNNVSVLLGNGDGTFQIAINYPGGTNPTSVSAGDFNGDGRMDLALANFGSNNVSVLLRASAVSLGEQPDLR